MDTLNPLPVETLVCIRITKEGVVFEAEAKVAYSQAGIGMGIEYSSALPQHFIKYQQWLTELKDKPLHYTAATDPNETARNGSAFNPTKVYGQVFGELLTILRMKGILSDREYNDIRQRLCR